MYRHKIYMFISVLLVIPLTINCLNYSERRIIEFEKGEFEDMSYRNRLQNMGYEFLFKIVDDFYVFATNKSWSTEEHEHVKHIMDGKVKTIYQDSNIFSAAGIDVDATAGDEDDSPDAPRSFPPYFDEAQEIDRSWAQGYTGRNVVIAVTDVGVDIDSPNLRENIASHLSYNFVDNNSDPRPEIFPDYPESLPLTNHGNACAGLIAGIKENNTCSLCGAGVAFNSKGRQGLGCIFVFPSGPHGNGFTNNIYTIGVASFGINGTVPRKSFVNSATLVSAFGQGRRRNDNGMLTVTHPYRGTASRMCDNKFGGSSAATALVSGMIALAVEAKQNKADAWFELVSSSNLTCQRQPYCIDKIETLIVKLSFIYPKHTQTVLSVISPCGTESILMEHAGEPPKDENDEGKNEGVAVDATFLSNHFWGEKMEGNWTVKIIGLGCYSHELCFIHKSELQFYGTNERLVAKEHSTKRPDKTTHDKRPSKKHKSNEVAIVTIVVAVAVVICGVVSVIICACCLRYRNRQRQTASGVVYNRLARA
ncbi:PCSK4-like protein [Mya arenaria]|uniref:PCSK4-like protein n=1 Tax=Mya arenaria TaxID=6604 RepID=A0ABY7E8R7_MYAAR|nr:PCSK4-like protein [Mya arenaria]